MFPTHYQRRAVHFAIQHTNLPIHDVTKSLEALKASGYDYHTFSLIPFTDEIGGVEEIPDDNNILIVPLSGTKLIDMSIRGKLPKNWCVFYNPEWFKQSAAIRFLGDKMLNYEAEFFQFGQIKNMPFAERVFVKPSNDLKAFAGVTIEKGWTLEEKLAEMMHQEIPVDLEILVAPVQKNLGREFRTVVTGQGLIDASQYMDETGKVNPKRVEDPEMRAKLIAKVYDTIGDFFPDEAFVVDFIEQGDELKIVEFNCVNASGLYDMDREHVFAELADAAWLP